VQAPRELLGNTVYKSRYYSPYPKKSLRWLTLSCSVKDWLYGITKNHPGGTAASVVDADFEAEDLLSVYHLVHWRKELGGAGITPGSGQWTNVSAIFPLHNHATNRVLLKHLSSQMFLTVDDLDSIRDLWGSKTAFYFAFIQTYFRSLFFPCVAGVIAWAFLPKYSLVFALIIGIWCTVFLEYWKIKQTDLALRWNVRGVGGLKENRPQFRYEKEIVDSAGRVRQIYPRWKRVLRQLVVVPFVLVSTSFLGMLITLVFVIETYISEAYEGPYKFYLVSTSSPRNTSLHLGLISSQEYMPTVLLAVFLPYVTDILESIATTMTEFENHRTADNHEMSLTQKIFVLNSITNYLPILLTAFVYVPFGDRIIPELQQIINSALGRADRKATTFIADPDRLRNELITLTLTGQIAGAFEELAMPWLKTQARQWWRERQATKAQESSTQPVADDPSEARFLRRTRRQALRPQYNVQEDIAEMVIQFGYLALFSNVWPLVPIGFLINNWIELRSDFLKISVECQRPAPTRSEGIGPWVASLECLTWLGSLSSAAIVHVFGSQRLLGDRVGLGLWTGLPITILFSEHMFMGFRAAVRFALSRIGSEQTRKERAERYAKRKRYIDELEANTTSKGHLDVTERNRRKSVRINAADLFWVSQAEEGASEQAGIGIIKAVKHSVNEEKVTGRSKFA
jgi:anoctamin-10